MLYILIGIILNDRHYISPQNVVMDSYLPDQKSGFRFWVTVTPLEIDDEKWSKKTKKKFNLVDIRFPDKMT